MTPLHLLIFFHSAWQELHQVIFAQVVSPFLVVFSGFSTETSTKTATRRANTKPKGGYVLFHCVCAYVQILLLLLANGKETKRAPSAYNLFVKEHMKTYLTDNPGKTTKDAMKHVRISFSFIIIAAHSLA
jgi:hypothetical protein